MVNETTPPNPVQNRGMWPPKNGREYQVLDSDDWRKIAGRERIDASDLIKFNFDTNVPEEVNWYLRELVGCKVTNDGRNYVFAGADPSKRKIYLPPAPDPQWDDVKSEKILKAIHVALKDDNKFTHEEVVDVVRAALDDGVLTPDELTDLWVLAENTMTEQMPPRSRAMVRYLIQAIPKAFGAAGQLTLTTALQRYAAGLIVDFLKRSGRSSFPRLDRDQVGIDLLLRVANPGIMNQDQAGLCGPVGFLYSIASDTPVFYANYVINLYDKGKASIGAIEITPSKACRSYSPPSSMSPADWIAAASLRDSENWLLDVDEDANGIKARFATGASQAEVEDWFKQSGYKDIKSKNNLVISLDSSDINDVNRYYNEGRRVVLRINAELLDAQTQSDTTHRANHFVVLSSPIVRTPQGVQLTIFTWGQGKFRIPQGAPLSEKDFLGDLYGYVAGKRF